MKHPERIRTLLVPSIPEPADPDLAEAARQTGLVGPQIAGMTLGYGIFFRSDARLDSRLIAHECRHVHQYETYPSIDAFLREYLSQVVIHGYQAAPLEVDARRFESVA